MLSGPNRENVIFGTVKKASPFSYSNGVAKQLISMQSLLISCVFFARLGITYDGGYFSSINYIILLEKINILNKITK